jgi:signal transduction histidine kinase
LLSALRIVCFGLLAGCILAVFHSRQTAVDAASDQQYRQELRTLQVWDTSLSNDLLEARAGLVTHYDDLVRRIAQLRAQSLILSDPPTFGPAAGRTEIGNATDNYRSVLMQQEEFIEAFKFDHAVLRNSLRFFPGEALALSKKVSSHPEGLALSTMLSSLYSDVLLYYLFSEPQLVDSLKEQIVAIRAVAPTWLSAQNKNSIQLLTRHAEIIMDRKPKVDDAIAGVLALPSEVRVQELGQSYSKYFSRASAVAQRASLWAWILTLAFVLAASAYIILRLRRSALALARATASLEETLEALGLEKEKHKELAELKSRFVSMTSHEFRTPLSVVLSSAELLQVYGERWPEEKKQTHLLRVQGAAKYMKQMLDDVLLIGRAEAGKLTSAPTVIDLAAFCEDLVETLRLHFQSEQNVDWTTTGDLSNTLIDQQLLTHILDNLLSNAFKYSAPDSTIHFDLRRDEEQVVLTIRDEGIGISHEDRDSLFETFHRGSNVGNVSGTGLGLAVVKKSLDVLEGSISMESKLDIGTTFVVKIPVQIEAFENLRDSA